MFNFKRFQVMLISAIVTIICVSSITSEPKDNLQYSCEKLIHYATVLPGNPSCWKNTDIGASPQEIIEKYKFPFERHRVITDDGYILGLFRIPQNAAPVLLIHGFAAGVESWFDLGEASFGFQLAKAGFDIWLIDLRGTYHSTNHTHFSIESKEFWNFTFHEQGIYDIKAVTEFIVSETGQKVTLVAHSLGTTSTIIYASLESEHAFQNVKAITCLGPMAYMTRTGILPIRVLALFWPSIEAILRAMGIHGIGRNIESFLDEFHNFCATAPTLLICSIFHFSFVGYSPNEEYFPSFPVGFAKFPSGISLKTIRHFAQLMYSSTFQECDGGPQYPLVNIRVPIHLYYGTKDPATRKEDVYSLYNDLKTEKIIEEVLDYSHYIFLAGKSTAEFYRTLIQRMQNF